MKQFGVITVARWMIEQSPKNVTAYMESRGKLFRLKRIKSYNGKTRPVLATLLTGHLGGEFTSKESHHTLSSPVFLSTNTNLAGIPIADIVEITEMVRPNCWAMKIMSETPVKHSESAQSQQVASQGAALGTPWYG